MKRILVLLFALVLVADIWADTKDYDEQYEGPGLEESVSGTNVGGTNVLEPATATSGLTGATSNWLDYCLESTRVDDNSAYYDLPQLAAGTGYPIFYFRIAYINGADSVGNNAENRLIHFWTDGWTLWGYLVLRNAGGTRQLWLYANDDGGGVNTYVGFPEIVQDTEFLIEVKWDATNDAWGWKINGVAQPNNVDATDPVESEGTLTGGHATDTGRLAIGWRLASYAATAYLDKLAYGNAGWIGDESAPGGGSAVPLLTHNRRMMQ